MAMYWPEQKVALDIVDDPYAEHVNEAQLVGWNVLKTTVAESQSLEGMRNLSDRLCVALGQQPPEKTPKWLAANERLFYELRDSIPGMELYR